ncbi:hypothetical protein [Egbenema bharatensis]|uniref:hypothetical protein n=1 Tax=Egbenema bharatensis TaxID=3463334 RepID=UPI003A864FE7
MNDQSKDPSSGKDQKNQSGSDQLQTQPATVAETPADLPPAAQPSESEATPAETVAAPELTAPAKPEAIEPAATSTKPASDEPNSSNQAIVRQQPIPPASEPMQYRAIGLVRGKYEASEEQFTRGNLLTDDGFSIGAVLLGRVMSLVKKHLDLEQPHLWVVYPRTREKGDSDLHVQIVGVWEPEKLNRMDGEGAEDDQSGFDAAELESELEDDAEAAKALASETAEAEEPEGAEIEQDDSEPDSEPADQPPQQVEATDTPAKAEATPLPSTDSDLDDKYFSVRGEIIYQSVEEERILVKIRRVPKPGTDESKAFKVSLKGKLEGKAVGYFWDLNVQREGNELVVRDGTLIAAVPPQKRKSGDGGYRGGGGKPRQRRPQAGPPGRKRWSGPPRDGQQQRPPSRSGDRPSPAQGRSPLPKPVIKRRNNPENSEG